MIECYMGNNCGKYFVLGYLLVPALILYEISSVTSLFIVSHFYEYLGDNCIQKLHMRRYIVE